MLHFRPDNSQNKNHRGDGRENGKVNLSMVLIIIGLSLNALASVILLIPNLTFEKTLKDDLVTITNQEKEKYFQGKDIKNFRIGIIGFVLFIFGFVFQIIGILVQIYG